MPQLNPLDMRPPDVRLRSFFVVILGWWVTFLLDGAVRPWIWVCGFGLLFAWHVMGAYLLIVYWKVLPRKHKISLALFILGI